MKKFGIEALRNVALAGHGGAGKTSLVEACLFDTGAIDRAGRVEEGTAATDFDPDEQRRHMSINLALAPLAWREHKINLLDTPGYSDFVGEVVSATGSRMRWCWSSPRRPAWRSARRWPGDWRRTRDLPRMVVREQDGSGERRLWTLPRATPRGVWERAASRCTCPSARKTVSPASLTWCTGRRTRARASEVKPGPIPAELEATVRAVSATC